MARTTNQPPPPLPAFSGKEGWVTETRTYDVITPMLGGGEKPHHADSQTIVRVSQIRGMLRFWWRATRGGHFGTIKELKQAESSIWGGSIGKEMVPSAVCISMNIENAGIECTSDSNISPTGSIEKLTSQKSKYSYVLFPLRTPKDVKLRKEEMIVKLHKNVVFRLIITYPESINQEVEAAFWAWETFGGVGARTRRGLGALCCTHINGIVQTLPAESKLLAFLQAGLRRHVVTGVPLPGMPHLQMTQSVGSYAPNGASVTATCWRSGTEIDTWKAAVDRYQMFRQTRHTSGAGKAERGGSIWPDANTLRGLAGVKQREQNGRPAPAQLPKAQLGLPIVVGFRDSKFDGATQEVKFDVGDPTGRHASPLILRPFRVGNGCVTLILILGGTRIDYPVRVKSESFSRTVVAEVPAVGNVDVTTPTRAPHGPTNTSDVLKGVFAYMQQA